MSTMYTMSVVHYELIQRVFKKWSVFKVSRLVADSNDKSESSTRLYLTSGVSRYASGSFPSNASFSCKAINFP